MTPSCREGLPSTSQDEALRSCHIPGQTPTQPPVTAHKPHIVTPASGHSLPPPASPITPTSRTAAPAPAQPPSSQSHPAMAQSHTFTQHPPAPHACPRQSLTREPRPLLHRGVQAKSGGLRKLGTSSHDGGVKGKQHPKAPWSPLPSSPQPRRGGGRGGSGSPRSRKPRSWGQTVPHTIPA